MADSLLLFDEAIIALVSHETEQHKIEKVLD